MSKGRVLIVGAGIGGLTVAHALSSRGYAVEIVDRGPIPNPLSSSHDEHRVLRHAYGPHVGYGRMVPAAFAAWDRLFADLGARYFRETGCIFVLRDDDRWARSSAEVMATTGAVFRPLPLDRLAERIPMLDLAGARSAFETLGDGTLYASRILGALVTRLAAMGVRFRAGTAVTDVDPEAGVVIAGPDRIAADHVVAAAGAWTAKLLPALSGDARPSRQAVLYVAPPADVAAAFERIPVVADFEGDTGTYLIPPGEGTRLKIGDHVFTMEGDPDDDRQPRPSDVERIARTAARTWRDFDRFAILEAKTCFYTVREADRFLVRRLGARGHVLTACSGHGFKFAPLVAELLAAAIDGETDDATVERTAAGIV